MDSHKTIAIFILCQDNLSSLLSVLRLWWIFIAGDWLLLQPPGVMTLATPTPSVVSGLNYLQNNILVMRQQQSNLQQNLNWSSQYIFLILILTQLNSDLLLPAVNKMEFEKITTTENWDLFWQYFLYIFFLIICNANFFNTTIISVIQQKSAMDIWRQMTTLNVSLKGHEKFFDAFT